MHSSRWFRGRAGGRILAVLPLLVLSLLLSCAHDNADSTIARRAPQEISGAVHHPEWSRNASIYEVNLRQYTPGGTFAEFEQHLPRLRRMGVGILWLMPIHPIGEKNRKGTLGSYYSVRDYLDVNPEFGTLAEFKSLVARIHEMDMHVIIDWVANHTAWDNPLVTEHPEWFTRDAAGNLVPPVADWSDVVDLNYGEPALWDYMIDAMEFWVREADVDGFRCDVAGMVPLDFWERARGELERIKPVFLLAEWESPEAHRKAFDMTYGWRLYGILNAIAQGKNTAADLDAYLRTESRTYPPDAYRMYFTSNHDENSWNGTVYERLGEGVSTFAVLTCTLDGMPLVYSGQEAGLDRRLAFFDKDLIEWMDDPMDVLYTTLLNLKKTHPALWNGDAGAPVVRVVTSDNRDVFAFVRERETDKVFVALNLSGEPLEVVLEGPSVPGDYTDAFTDEPVSLGDRVSLALEPWGYRVLYQ